MKFPLMIVSLALLFLSHTAHADIVSLSWGGQIFLQADATSDPWNVGAGGDFTATWEIDTDAIDLHSGIENARFTANLASFELDGVSATEFSDTIFLLSDNLGNRVNDSLSGRSDIVFNGVSQRFPTTLHLAPTSFTLSQPLQSIPSIAQGSAVVDSSIASVQSTNFYRTVVPVGERLTIASVPEPSSWAILSLLSLPALLRRHR